MRTLTGGYNDPVNYVDLLGLDPAAVLETVKQIAADPGAQEAVRQGAPLVAAGAGAVGAGGTAAGAGTIAAVAWPVALIVAGIIVGVSLPFVIDGMANSNYELREQIEQGKIKDSSTSNLDAESDVNIVIPGSQQVYNNFKNSADKVDVDKINRKILKEAYGPDTILVRAPEDALEDFTDQDMVAHESQLRNNKKRKVTNPDGRKGGEKHQAVVEEIIEEIDRRNGSYEKEFRFQTPDGMKSYRAADVVEVIPGTDIVIRIYQVGKGIKSGDPVSRERYAIRDIFNSLKYNGAPIEYRNYDTGEIAEYTEDTCNF